jgi:DNA polymerase-3 subunit epsilon
MEIAIFKFDGNEIVDKFVSLINPERKIQSFVKRLTGIDEEITRLAPKFYEVAKRIIEITEDCIIVAHNAQFDYRMLQTEFTRLGYEFKRETLCTIELSKELIPDMPSYSLGKLTKALGIPISKRHRAEGDAQATVKLLKIILNKDSENNIVKKHIRERPKKQVDTKLLNILEPLPKETGIYFFYDKEDNPLYVGKSNNIHKRVSQHFSSTNPKSRSLQRKIAYVKHELTGSELIALLKENEFIKKLQPEYNSALTKTKFTHGVYLSTDKKGYQLLKIKPINAKGKPITTFSSLTSAKGFLEQMVTSYQLCLNKTSLGNTQKSCFKHGLKECLGACVGDESPESYNERVQALIDRYSFGKKNMLLITKGRNVNEKSLVYIKQGEVAGVGFFELNLQITNLEILERILFPIEHQRDAKHITQSFLRRYPNLVKLVIL